MALKMVDGGERATSSSVTRPVEVVDDDVDYMAPWSKWSCLGASWWLGDHVGERRGRGKDDNDEVR
jgi:hypothetical protein